MITLYGIANCGTIKKARTWLENNDIEYVFYDYKTTGVDEDVLKRAMQHYGWEKVVNRAGMTWRKLPEDRKAEVLDDNSALALMQEKPSVIKRPILVGDHMLLLGFAENQWRESMCTPV
jgi:arsenate reductase